MSFASNVIQGLLSTGTPSGGLDFRQLGATVGRMPQQQKDQQKKKEEEEKQKQLARATMSAQTNQDPAAMRAVAERLLEANRPDQAMRLNEVARQLEEKQKLTRGETALVKFGTARGRNMRDPKAKEDFFKMASVYGINPTRSSELYEQFVDPIKEGFTLPAGSARYDSEGNLIAREGFKPADPKAPKFNIVRGTKDDPNIRIFKNGQLIDTIPTQKEGETLEDAEKRLSAVSEFVRIKDDITTLMGDEYMASGITGAVFARWLPGSDARDRDRIIQSLRANLGMTEIRRLKEMSDRGATGLGQVSNLELNALQSTIASLDVSMSEEAQMRSLKKIFNHLDRAQKIASGVIPKDAIPWNSEPYKAGGYSQDTNTGEVFYAPFGPDGKIYHLVEGEFKPVP